MPEIDGTVRERHTRRCGHEREHDSERYTSRRAGQSGEARSDVAAHDAGSRFSTSDRWTRHRETDLRSPRDLGARRVRVGDAVVGGSRRCSRAEWIAPRLALKRAASRSAPRRIHCSAGEAEVAVQAAEFVVVVVLMTHGSAMGGGGATCLGFNNTRPGGNPHLPAQRARNLCVGRTRGETAGVERRNANLRPTARRQPRG